MTTATLPLDPLRRAAAARLGRRPTNIAAGSHGVAELDLTTADLADAIGVTRRTVQRWKDNGLNGTAADEAATALDLHPSAIWPEWDLTEVDALTFAVTCPTCAGPVSWERPLKTPKHDTARQVCRVVCPPCAADYRVTVTIEPDLEELDA